MNKYILYFFLFFSAAALLLSCRRQGNVADMRESFGYRDKKPFGTLAAYNLFQKSYPGKKVELNNFSFGDNFSWNYDTASLYMNVSRHFYTSEKDAEALLDFVYKGNTAFIASSNIDSILLNKIFCRQTSDELFAYLTGRPFRKTSLHLIDVITPAEDSFSYFFIPFSNYFPEINNSYARIAGYNESGKTNFFVFFWGKGRLYLHAEPRAFSNYFLLTGENFRYMQHILEVLPAAPENIYWDNFYNRRNRAVNGDGTDDDSNGNDFSTFGTIMKYPGLAAAFWISLALLLLYIFFNSKRRQRIVPVVSAPANTSIAFSEAIAGVYLAEKNNRLIAEKMITYFNEFLRTKYFISANINDPGYPEVLGKKSGVPADTTAALVKAIKEVGEGNKVSDQQLLLLNGLIEKFYKNKA